MARISLMVFLLSLSFLFYSCDKSDIEFDGKYQKSLQSWQSFKELSDNTYRYVVTDATWAGMRWETTITVSKGKVVRREYNAIVGPEWGEELPEDQLHWIEEGDEVGSHQDSGAAEPLTLDEVYAKAKNEWLVKRDDVKTFFDTENNGMISSCGYVEDGCADDCFRGIRIASIVPLAQLSDGTTRMRATIVEDELHLTITSSGCDGATWTARLVDLENLAYSNPPQRSGEIVFENNEACLAIITKDFIFDLKPYRVDGSHKVLIRLEGWSHPLLYQY